MINNDLFDLFFNPFSWDKSSYRFTRDESDRSPYSIIADKEKKVLTIIHNVLGLEKEDLKIDLQNVDGEEYIIIAGKTVDNISGKEYSINSRFTLDIKTLDIDNITSTMKNGLLYINIPYQSQINKGEKRSIEIE